MPRDLFGDVVHPSTGIGSRRRYTLPLSILVHTLVIAAAVIVPLTAADVLPALPSMMAFITAAPPPLPPPPPAPPVAAAASRAVLQVNPAAAPTEAPSEIKPETGLEPEATAGKGVEGGFLRNPGQHHAWPAGGAALAPAGPDRPDSHQPGHPPAGEDPRRAAAVPARLPSPRACRERSSWKPSSAPTAG